MSVYQIIVFCMLLQPTRKWPRKSVKMRLPRKVIVSDSVLNDWLRVGDVQSSGLVVISRCDIHGDACLNQSACHCPQHRTRPASKCGDGRDDVKNLHVLSLYSW